MVGSSDATRADTDLLAALQAKGHPVTSRQLKRWRRAGVLASPIQRSAGRGHGRPSIAYPPEALQQATAIVELLAERVPLKHIAVAMLLRGVTVDEQAVRQAFLELLDLKIARTDLPDERADAADRLARHALRRARRHALGRHWSAHAGGHDQRRGLVLEDMLAGLLGQAVTGDTPSPESREAVTHIVGIDSEDSARFHDVVSMLTMDSLESIAATVTLTELEVAMKQLGDIFSEIPHNGAAPNY